MFNFLRHSVNDLARITGIARVTDQEIWSLLTPITLAFLGKPLSAELRVMETVDGLFPGDEVANLSDHRLYGGQEGFVRYPYLHSLYRTEHGAVVIKRDGTTFQLFAWYGEIEGGGAELMFKVGLRDRRYDGLPGANDSALNPYPVDDPIMCRQLGAGVRSVEIGLYGFLPGTRLSDSMHNYELERFVANPYAFLDTPKKFLELFGRIRQTNRSPGQSSARIPDVSKLVPPKLERIAEKYHYDFIEVCPSHYHVAKLFENRGFVYTDAEQKNTLAQFDFGIERLRASGMNLSRPGQSWLCVVQSLRPSSLIPESMFLDGPIWPQDNIQQQYLWMNKRLGNTQPR